MKTIREILNMKTIREILKFLSGAQAFHLLAHIYFAIIKPFPVDLGFFILKERFNLIAIGYNLIIFVVLFYFAYFYNKNKDIQSLKW